MNSMQANGLMEDVETIIKIAAGHAVIRVVTAVAGRVLRVLRGFPVQPVPQVRKELRVQLDRRESRVLQEAQPAQQVRQVLRE